MSKRQLDGSWGLAAYISVKRGEYVPEAVVGADDRTIFFKAKSSETKKYVPMRVDFDPHARFWSRPVLCPEGSRLNDVPNARWHEAHTFTCFAYPTFSEADMEQIAAALVKVIRAYS